MENNDQILLISPNSSSLSTKLSFTDQEPKTTSSDITDNKIIYSFDISTDTNKQKISEYYSTNFPEFKSFYIGKFLFIKMGKTFTFNFDKLTYKPKFSIGPNWYCTIILYIIIIGLSNLLYRTLLNKTNKIQVIIFIIMILIIIFFVNKTAITNPGIILNKNNRKNCLCDICKVYYDENEKVKHCRFCGVCVEKMDHHCIWMGKCIGKYNKKSFYAMIVWVVLTYLYVVICFFWFYIQGANKLLKNKNKTIFSN